MLLALQLVLAFQLQAVQAVAASMPAHGAMQLHTDSQTSAAAHSPMTAGAMSSSQSPMAAVSPVKTTAEAVAAATFDPAADSATSQPDCPEHSTPHDCCHANACQCHCVYTPGAIALPALADLAASAAMTSLATTQFVAPRIDEFLRPPIA